MQNSFPRKGFQWRTREGSALLENNGKFLLNMSTSNLPNYRGGHETCAFILCQWNSKATADGACVKRTCHFHSCYFGSMLFSTVDMSPERYLLSCGNTQEAPSKHKIENYILNAIPLMPTEKALSKGGGNPNKSSVSVLRNKNGRN